MDKEYLTKFKDKRIIITGGLGFIGSNLAKALVELDEPPKEVIIFDCLMPGQGGSLNNIKEIESKVYVPNINDGGVNISDKEKTLPYIKNIDYIFNLAGSVSHIGSKKNPIGDLDLNVRPHISFLESCCETIKSKDNSPELKVVFTSTRDIYGKISEGDLPIREDYSAKVHADPQGIHNSATEYHHLWHASNFGFNSTILRLTNTYGPRQKINDPEQGFLGFFIYQALRNETIELWGGGEVVRDFNYVDDVVDALLRVAVSGKTSGEAYNLGCYHISGGKPLIIGDNIKTVAEAAHEIIRISGRGSTKIKPYPESHKLIEPGHFFANASKIYLHTGWKSRTTFEQGLSRTISFYENNRAYLHPSENNKNPS